MWLDFSTLAQRVATGLSDFSSQHTEKALLAKIDGVEQIGRDLEGRGGRHGGQLVRRGRERQEKRESR